MKALTVKQPWAYLICSSVKDVENRTWKCPQKYIGQRVLIHASADKKLNLKVLSKKQYAEACDIFTPKNAIPVKPVDKWDRSAIIGAVKIVDCVINHPSIWAEKSPYTHAREDWKPTYNWVLANPILFDKPILNAKGKLLFWDYPGIQEVSIECPHCGSHEIAIEDYTTMPFPTFVHRCSCCSYLIMESEWNIVKQNDNR